MFHLSTTFRLVRVALVAGTFIGSAVAQPYSSAHTEATLDARTINTSLEVGVVAGAHGVSAMGSATYTIPIQVPPGTNGVVPQLAVVYDSHAGNGLLGYGWNLSGLSSISRTGAICTTMA